VSALAEALVAAQRRALSALEKGWPMCRLCQGREVLHAAVLLGVDVHASPHKEGAEAEDDLAVMEADRG
jgi:hypothetical protein